MTAPSSRRLRIAVIGQSYPPLHGGVAEHIAELSAELARRGHRVTVVTGGREVGRSGGPWGAAGPDNGRPLPRVRREGGVRVVRVGRTLRVPANGASACVALGIPPLRRLGLLARGSYDVVHIHAPFEPTLPLAALMSIRDPIVATFHSAGDLHWALRVFRGALAPFARRIRARIAVSRAAEEFVAPLFGGRYTIIPNGIDRIRFHPDPLPGGDGPLTLLSVGRLDPRKGIETVLDALPGIREAVGRPVQYIVAGNGPRRRSLEQRARRISVPVRFLGAVDRSTLPDLYRSAHLVVAPALRGESFGVVLLESLASARPVVASDLPGYRDVLGSGKGSRLYRAGSGDGLVEAVAWVSRRDRLEALSREAPEVAARYDWRRVAAEVEEVYGSVLEGRDLRGSPSPRCRTGGGSSSCTPPCAPAPR